MATTQRCQQCGYDLSSASPEAPEPRCPECGTLYLYGAHPAPEWPGLSRALLDACTPFFLLFGIILLLTALFGPRAFPCLSVIYSIPLLALGVIVPIKVARRCAMRFPTRELKWASQHRVAIVAVLINASAVAAALLAVRLWSHK